MTYRRIAAVIALVAGFSACATTALQTECEFTAPADFSRYTGYAWSIDSPSRVEGVGTQILITFEKAIERALEEKGYRHVEIDEADLFVSFGVTTAQKIESAYLLPNQVDSLGEPALVMARSYERGSLIIDLFDAASGQRIWHGWASKVLQSSDKEYPTPVINKAVRATLEPLPDAEAERT